MEVEVSVVEVEEEEVGVGFKDSCLPKKQTKNKFSPLFSQKSGNIAPGFAQAPRRVVGIGFL